MILPVDITSVKSPGLAESAPSVAASQLVPSASNLAQGALGNLTQVAVGQLFQAQVLSQLEDGTFLVNVADNALRMALPAGTSVGSTVSMTLLAAEPRPAFLLEQQNSGGSAMLSDAAKVINTVLQTAQQSNAPTSLVGKTPLLTSPTANAPEIKSVLQDSIEFSGLFYESHVGQWVDGERPFSDLLREPQVKEQLSGGVVDENPTATATSMAKSQVNNTGTRLQLPPTTESELSRLVGDARGQTDGQSKLSQALNTLLNARNLPQEADTIVRTSVLSQETSQTINLQLNSLEQHRVAWQGELWPGQHFEWEVNDESANQGKSGSSNPNESTWQSVVRFDLPTLGKISASLHLSAGHVQIRVNTSEESSAATLKAHVDDLANALEAAGLPLDSLIIK